MGKPLLIEHPNCPECNSSKVISKGISWLCKDCGRWFSKKMRTKMTCEPDYTAYLNKRKTIILK